jgi:hypothetical protein
MRDAGAGWGVGWSKFGFGAARSFRCGFGSLPIVQSSTNPVFSPFVAALNSLGLVPTDRAGALRLAASTCMAPRDRAYTTYTSYRRARGGGATAGMMAERRGLRGECYFLRSSSPCWTWPLASAVTVGSSRAS